MGKRGEWVETNFPTVGWDWPVCRVWIGIGYLYGRRCYTLGILDTTVQPPAEGPRTLAHRWEVEPWLIAHGFTDEEAHYMLQSAEQALAGQADN